MDPQLLCVWVDDPQTRYQGESPGHGGHEKLPYPHHPSTSIRSIYVPLSRSIRLLLYNCSPRALATSGRRPGVRAKRAARGVARRQLLTGVHETAVQLQLL